MRLVVGSHHAVGLVDATTGEVVDRYELTNPSFVARHGELLYVVDEDPHGPGSVHALRWDAEGLHRHGVHRVSGGMQPCHVSVHPDRRHLLVSNYGDGHLTVVPLETDGTLGEPCDVVVRTGSGTDPDRQTGPHAHQAVTDPSRQWVLACDLGTDQVAVYRFDTSAGTLRLHTQAHVGPGQGPRHLTFTSPRRVWIAGELASSVIVGDWEPDTGSLTPREVISTSRGVPVGNYPGAVVADAERVYVTNRGENSVCVIDIASATPVAHHPCGGDWPRDACLADGRLFVANEGSGDVSRIDPRTGESTRVATFEGVTSVMALPSP